MITHALFPAGAAALGLALLDGRVIPALWLSLRCAAGVALWAALWLAGAGWLAGTPWLGTVNATPLHGLALNAGLACAAALLPALILWLTSRPAPLGALHGLAWYAGLVLPQLGQGGAWPPESQALAIIGAALAMALCSLAGRH